MIKNRTKFTIGLLSILLPLFIGCKKKAPSSVTVKVGQAYGGGVVAYILQSNDPGYDPNVQHGLITSEADLPIGYPWLNNTYIFTGATDTAIGSGAANTNTIIKSVGDGSYAALACRNYSGGGYKDWFLPSLGELHRLFLNKDKIGGFGTGTVSRPYWSSTDIAGGNMGASYVEFGNGAKNGGEKRTVMRVRPVRSF